MVIKVLFVRITEEQMEDLESRSRSLRFMRLSDYVRMILFKNTPIEEKINKIYEKMCKDDE